MELVLQNTPSTSRDRIQFYPNYNGFEIQEVDERGRFIREHEACMIAKVWNWPWYKGGACKACEELAERTWKEFIDKVQKDLPHHMGAVGIGQRHHNCTIEGFEGADSIKKACQEIAKNPADLVLSGPPGTGKTHLAAAIVRELILAGKIFRVHDWGYEQKMAKFITVPNLFIDIKKSFNDKEADTEAEIIEKLSRIALLILDDLGSEKPTEWAITTLYTIIDARYRDMKPTIITTNLTLDQIATQLHERIASRLSSGKVIRLKGTDRRPRREKQGDKNEER